MKSVEKRDPRPSRARPDRAGPRSRSSFGNRRRAVSRRWRLERALSCARSRRRSARLEASIRRDHRGRSRRVPIPEASGRARSAPWTHALAIAARRADRSSASRPSLAERRARRGGGPAHAQGAPSPRRSRRCPRASSSTIADDRLVVCKRPLSYREMFIAAPAIELVARRRLRGGHPPPRVAAGLIATGTQTPAEWVAARLQRQPATRRGAYEQQRRRRQVAQDQRAGAPRRSAASASFTEHQRAEGPRAPASGELVDRLARRRRDQATQATLAKSRFPLANIEP